MFLVGAPKCGTSAMYDQLGRHPDVFAPALKEPQFFGDDQHRLNCVRPSLEGYLDLYRDARVGQRILDGSTTYLHSTTAAREIHDFEPRARILVMLRDPVAVMHAYHGEMVAGGFETIRDFPSALAAEPDRRAGRRLPDRAGLRECLYYRWIVRSAQHLERFFDVFGRERVHVILYDDWVADMAGTYRDTLRFLDLDDGFVPAFDVVNPSHRVRWARLHDAIFEPPRPVRAAARTLVPEQIRGRVRYGLAGLNTVEARRDPVPPPLAAALRAELVPEIERLGALLERDLRAWVEPVA